MASTRKDETHDQQERLGSLEGHVERRQGHDFDRNRRLKDEPYGFNTRFEGKKGTNPEELIAAAHASCFSMALSLVLASTI